MMQPCLWKASWLALALLHGAQLGAGQDAAPALRGSSDSSGGMPEPGGASGAEAVPQQQEAAEEPIAGETQPRLDTAADAHPGSPDEEGAAKAATAAEAPDAAAVVVEAAAPVAAAPPSPHAADPSPGDGPAAPLPEVAAGAAAALPQDTPTAAVAATGEGRGEEEEEAEGAAAAMPDIPAAEGAAAAAAAMPDAPAAEGAAAAAAAAVAAAMPDAPAAEGAAAAAAAAEAEPAPVPDAAAAAAPPPPSPEPAIDPAAVSTPKGEQEVAGINAPGPNVKDSSGELANRAGHAAAGEASPADASAQGSQPEGHSTAAGATASSQDSSGHRPDECPSKLITTQAALEKAEAAATALKEELDTSETAAGECNIARHDLAESMKSKEAEWQTSEADLRRQNMELSRQRMEETAELRANLEELTAELKNKTRELASVARNTAMLQELLSQLQANTEARQQKHEALQKQYRELEARYEDPSLKHFLTTMAVKAYKHPFIEGATNDTFHYVIPTLRAGQLLGRQFLNETQSAVYARLSNGPDEAAPWLPVVTGLLVYGLVFVPFLCTVCCLTRVVCRPKLILVFCHLYLAIAALCASAFAACTGTDPLSLFAARDLSLYIFVQAAFSLVFALYATLVLVLRCFVADNSVRGYRSLQLGVITVVACTYYALVWTPAMEHKLPQVDVILEAVLKPWLSSQMVSMLLWAPYLVLTLLFAMLLRVEQLCWEQSRREKLTVDVTPDGVRAFIAECKSRGGEMLTELTTLVQNSPEKGD